MKSFFANIFLIIIVVISALLFTTCKKYDENTIWFKKPEKAFTGGYLTSFNVNGVDSLPMWDSIYSVPPEYNGWGGKYNILDTRFIYNYKDKKNLTLSSNLGAGTLVFNSKKKEVEIGFVMSTPVGFSEPKHNIFLTKKSVWKILKLTKTGTLKIQRNYNGKTYEIQINWIFI
jgi:hypothetical protein